MFYTTVGNLSNLIQCESYILMQLWESHHQLKVPKGLKINEITLATNVTPVFSLMIAFAKHQKLKM